MTSVPLLRKDTYFASQFVLTRSRVDDQGAVVDGLTGKLLIDKGIVIDEAIHSGHSCGFT